jgi:hypothetical protein
MLAGKDREEIVKRYAMRWSHAPAGRAGGGGP